MSNDKNPLPRSGEQDIEGAIKDLDRAIQLAPNDSNLYATRSLYRTAKYDISNAISDGEKAVALNPQSWIAYYARGRAYDIDDTRYVVQPTVTESGNKSIRDFTQALRVNPKFGEAYGCRANVYTHQGRLDEAFADLKEALKYDPGNWLLDMQQVVNSLADDGYTFIEMLPVPVVMGMPEYNKVVKSSITDWDHYLQWRLKRKAERSSQKPSNRPTKLTSNRDTLSTYANPSPPSTNLSLEREIDKEASKQYQELGLKHKRAGNYRASVEAYQKSIELNYTDPLTYYGLAKTCYLAGKAREAIRNYLCTIHLSMGNMIVAYNDPTEPNLIKIQRKLIEAQLTPSELAEFRQIHPYVDLLLLDPNTPSHLGHVLVDLNKSIKKSRKLKGYISTYTKALKCDNTVKVDDEIEDAHYLGIGRTFAVHNLRWESLERHDPYTIYKSTNQLIFDDLQDLIAKLPKGWF